MKETLMFGKYRPVQLLSNGIGGEVWVAEHIKLGAYRVIKCLYKEQPYYRDLLQEAHLLKKLAHPFFPQIYDIEEDEHASYIIEEYLAGENLKDFFLRQKCLPELWILTYSIQLCEIIEYLHSEAAGIVHLDLKPEHLLLQGEQMKLVDFGSAVAVGEKTRSTHLFLSDGYAAPEQYIEETPGIGADIYSIGRLIQFMLANGKEYDKRLEKISERCTCVLPSKRYESVSELKAELEELLTGSKGKRKKTRTVKPAGLCVGIAAVEEETAALTAAVLFANYFRELQGKRTALLDFSGRAELEKMQEILPGCKTEQAKEESFFAQGVAYCKHAGTAQIGDCLAQGYEVLVMNFGCRLEQNKTEFLRCERRFVIGDTFPWHLAAWEETELLLSAKAKRQVTALVTGGSPAELSRAVFERILCFPTVTDVLLPKASAAKFLRQLF